MVDFYAEKKICLKQFTGKTTTPTIIINLAVKENLFAI